ncbi:MAG: hypothetical protein K940chlam9_01393 [Chlamydiae bacterium]|nr:hypothetical protein [Chlamydiota bacterium]
MLEKKVKKYLDSLVSRGRYYFTLYELEENLGRSKGSILVSLSRLKKAEEIASPARGYYIIIPLEYRTLGCLPPDQFIPDLMKFLNLPYYVSLLSAGMYYGAAHQQPQVFQVMVPSTRRNFEIGKVRVAFHANKNLTACPIRKFNTPRSVLIVSSPEGTAFDLVAYPQASGGFSNVFTVLSELIESMNLNEFRKFLTTRREFAVLQRLGYLFEQLGNKDFADVVEQCLKMHVFERAVLDPRYPSREEEVVKRWKLLVNEPIESDV